MTPPREPADLAALLHEAMSGDSFSGTLCIGEHLGVGLCQRVAERLSPALRAAAHRPDVREDAELRRLVDEQAEDEGLWFVAEHAPEAYLQQELRRLHAAIESLPEAQP